MVRTGSALGTLGRAREQARISDVLDHALGGTACGMLLRGPAGIGKTALVRWARAEAIARGFVAIETTGEDGSVPAPYSGLAELLAGHDDVVTCDESGLLAAALDGTVSASERRIAAAFLDAVTARSEETPVVVIVDDAPWVDGSTMTAVATLARRSAADRVALLVTSREELAWWGSTAFEAIELAGLDADASLALLRSRTDLDDLTALDCWRESAGNPLAMIELGPSWSRDGSAEVRLPERMQRAFDDQLAALGPDVAAALLLVALERTAGRGAARAAIDAAGSASALDRATAAMVLVADGGGVRFRHPLLRTRVLALAGADAVRDAHLRLADAAGVVGDREGRTWHLAEAASAPDEVLASELFEIGQACRRRGAPSGWLRASERAAALSADPEAMGLRLADAVDAAWYLGDHERVEELFQRGQRASSAAEVRGKLAMAYGQEVTWRDGPLAGYRLLQREADAIAADAPLPAAICAAFASAAATIAVRADLALSSARRAVEIAEATDDLVARMVAQCALGSAAQLVGESATADALLGPVEAVGVAAADAGMTDAEHLVTYAAMAHGYAERWDRAIDLVGGMLRRGRAAGAPELIAQANTTMAELAMRTGRWAEAYGLIRTTIDDPDWGVPGERAWVHAVHARICAGLGRDEECRAAASAALAIALPTGFTVAEVWARSALGLLELGAGRPEAALVQLDRVQAVHDASGSVEPGTLWWQGDQLDALVAAGDAVRARERAAEVGAVAERTGRRYALAASARARAQLADVDVAAAELAFAESIEAATALGSPFELARCLLARSGHRSRHALPGASDDAEWAAALFESLGAAAWLARASTARSSGATLAVDRLSPSELRVAMAVARGLTNRQAAIELYLSTKTVDFYLQSIYRKLDVRTRTEMARVVLGADR